MRIALDLDGVLADSMGMWLNIWNERNHLKLNYSDINKWDFWRDLGISEGVFNRIFNEAWERWEEIRPMEGDIAKKVERLNELGRVDILTGRPKNNRRFIERWLSHHGIEYKTLIIATGGKSRYPHDVFIDDSPFNASEVASTGRYVLLRDQPWNREVMESRLIKRVPNIESAAEVIATL